MGKKIAMSHTLLSDQVLDLESDTVAAVGKYLGYEYQTEPLPYIFRPLPILSLGVELGQSWMENDQIPFSLFSGQDILKLMGPISKEDYDYYENS